MRRLLAAGLLALVGAMGTGVAADLTAPALPTTKASIPASTIDWSGFYVGVNAGGDLVWRQWIRRRRQRSVACASEQLGQCPHNL
jgi:opacity protein-like surface antigen